MNTDIGNIPLNTIDEIIDILIRCYYISITFTEKDFSVENSKYGKNISYYKKTIDDKNRKTQISNILKKSILIRVHEKEQIYKDHIKELNDSFDRGTTHKLVYENRPNDDKIKGIAYVDYNNDKWNSNLCEIDEQEVMLNQLKFFKHLSKIINISFNQNLFFSYFSNSIKIHFCKNIIEYLSKEKKEKTIFLSEKKNNFTNLLYYRGNKVNFDLSTSLFREKNATIRTHYQ